ncbi:Spo0E family sporulation regulatory protein-aspartic acid phosphatase [Mesobacillus zeae]|uniref:Spo0E family sporulation regulatory protein-aspartic acid phosphatase n=1 Tax=Mesobacillus zeae TaxID=1917180 RepID=UPI0039F0F132
MESATILILKEIKEYIEFLRNHMISTGAEFGFHHERTIKASQELDYVIYKYQVIQRRILA